MIDNKQFIGYNELSNRILETQATQVVGILQSEKDVISLINYSDDHQFSIARKCVSQSFYCITRVSLKLQVQAHIYHATCKSRSTSFPIPKRCNLTTKHFQKWISINPHKYYIHFNLGKMKDLFNPFQDYISLGLRIYFILLCILLYMNRSNNLIQTNYSKSIT